MEDFAMREELLKGLTEEQKKKVAECKSADEIIALAKKEDVTLTDEQLEAVSGGECAERDEEDRDKFDDKSHEKQIKR